MQNVLGLDHVVVLVRDLGDAEEGLRRLGFLPTPRGVHSAHMGTANTTVVFPDRTYIEALGVLEPTPANRSIRAVLTAREGPWGLAFKTKDATAAANEFLAAGIGDGTVNDFARPVRLPSGTREAAFRIAPTDPARTPGAWLFVCQHRTPEVTWREDFLDQPNGATGVAEVLGVATDPRAIAATYRPVFGDRLTETPTGIVIAAGEARISFSRPEALVERFAPLRLDWGAAPCLVGLRLRTASLEPTEGVLASAGIRSQRTADDRLLVAPDDACGTLVEFAPY